MKTRNFLFLAAFIVVNTAIFSATFWFAGQKFVGTEELSFAAKLILASFATLLGGLVLFPVWKNIFIVKREDKSSQAMKIIIGLVVFAGALSSCASTQASYAEVNGKLTNLQRQRVANYVAVQRMQRTENTEARYTELDFKRLQSQPVMADSLKGYEGKLVNLSRWENVQFQIYRLSKDGKITSTRPISSIVSPGQQLTKYLLPGEYWCIVYVRGKKEDERILKVSSELVDVFGEDMHWYAVWDRGR